MHSSFIDSWRYIWRRKSSILGYDDCGNPTPTKYALLARVKENLVKLLLLSTEYATSVHLLFFSELCRNQFLLSPCPASHLAPRQTFEFGFCAKRDRCSATGNCQNWLNAVVSRALMLFCDVLQLDRALCHRQVFCKRFTRWWVSCHILWAWQLIL